MARVLVLASLPESLVNFRRVLLDMMVSAGHEVIAAAPAHGPTRLELSRLGVAFESVELERNRISPIGDIRYFFNVFSLIKRLRPDVVLAYTIKPVAFGSLAARLAGGSRFSALITGRGQVFAERHDLRNRAVRAWAIVLLRHGLRRARTVFFQNDEDQEFFLARQIVTASQAARINGSGVDLDAFRAVPLPNKTAFLMLSRLIREKGVHDYVEAAAVVRRRHPEVQCFLAGPLERSVTGVANAELEAWQSEGTIRYLGALEDVREAITRAAVVVLPSYYPEGVPRSLLEALAMGRPVIATDTPGCRDTTYGGQTGIVVPARNSAALATAMMRFVDEPALAQAMSKRCRAVAEEKYDARVIGGAILEALSLA